MFGGVQVVHVVTALVRSKFIAIFLGPTGMGIAGLLTSTINVVGQLSKLGLDTSAVKEIAAVNRTDDKKLRLIITTLKRVVWFTGVFSLLLCMVCASFLSRLTFGNTDYTWSFVWISVALLFKQLTYAELAVLQGLRKLKYLAKTNVYASVIGLMVVVPLYYYYRIDGIVPAIIVSAIISYIFSKRYTGKLGIAPVQISIKKTCHEAKAMLKLGLMLTINSGMALLSAYAVQVFISRVGGLDQVGLFLAGFVIINNYVGLIFNAMQTDYFPRLSAIANTLHQLRQTVHHQAVIALLIITPIIIVFFMLAPLAVQVLYSNAFLPITDFVAWGMFGTLFKTVSWSMGYVILAKGDSNLFIKTAILFNVLFVALLLPGYYYYGLLGLGVAFFVYYILHFILIKIITYQRYGLRFNKGFNKLFITCLLMCSVAFACRYLSIPWLQYGSMLVMVIVSVVFSGYQLHQKANIKVFWQQLFKKKND